MHNSTYQGPENYMLRGTESPLYKHSNCWLWNTIFT